MLGWVKIKTKKKIKMNIDKKVLTNVLLLERAFSDYKDGKEGTYNKFEYVWGAEMANHFLLKYSDAESLIWALDERNLRLFIDRF